MEDKPVTALVLLPPLELIDVKSLPKRSTEELVSLKQERGLLLHEVYKSAVISGAGVLGTTLSLVALVFLTSSFLTFLCGAAIFFGCAGYTSILLGRLTSEMRAFRKKAITPELQIGVGNEQIVSEMTQLTNSQIVSWNKKVQCAPTEDIDRRFLKVLKKERTLISTNIETVKRLAEAIERDRNSFELGKKDEPETE